jgi:Fe-S oxidoreductase
MEGKGETIFSAGKGYFRILVVAGYKPKVSGKTLGVKRRLTFHDPCHLRRKQGILDGPRKLLKSVPGVEFIETGNENLCCGSGGSFNVSHYDLSKKNLSTENQTH